MATWWKRRRRLVHDDYGPATECGNQRGVYGLEAWNGATWWAEPARPTLGAERRADVANLPRVWR